MAEKEKSEVLIHKLRGYLVKRSEKMVEDIDFRELSKEITEKVEQITSQNPPNLEDEKIFEDSDGETVLHAAVSRLVCTKENQFQRKILEQLINNLHYLIKVDRYLSTRYTGQTPFHMAVCKGSKWLVRKMIEALKEKELEEIWKSRATGTIFYNTAMMGELPLTVAALTTNTGMVRLLLINNADICLKNSKGDNVFHSLIRYAFLYDDKLSKVKAMFEFILDYASKHKLLKEKLLLTENDEGKTPLQLAALFGIPALFTLIMEQKQVYCFTNTTDGLFDLKVYDVTEMDAISSMDLSEVTGKPADKVVGRSRNDVSSKKKTFQNSILMILSELEQGRAFQFLHYQPISFIITQKWNAYRTIFYPLWLFHFVFMVLLTWSAVLRSKHAEIVNGTFDLAAQPVYVNKPGDNKFTTAISGIACFVATLYIVQECVRVCRGKMELRVQSFTNAYNNAWFRIISIIMSLSLLADLPASVSPFYENYCLTLAVILGWFLMLFFLRAARPFSFFTLLIQRVLLDMARFFVIIALELVAFGTAIYMFIQGSNVSQESGYTNYWRVLASLIQLMVGLGEVPDFYDTRKFSLTVATFIMFIIMTTVLMINALIALMSDTCTELVQNGGSHEHHWKMQRLSTILFIESVLPNAAVKRIGEKLTCERFNNAFQKRNSIAVYRLQIVSLQSDEDVHSSIRSELTKHLLLRGTKNKVFDKFNYKKKRTSTKLPTLSETLQTNYSTRLMGTTHSLDIFETTMCSKCGEGPDLRTTMTQT